MQGRDDGQRQFLDVESVARQTAEAVTFDLRWKAACGFAVTDTSFHHSVLTYWRRRLAASGRPHRIFEAVAEVIAATGVLVGSSASRC